MFFPSYYDHEIKSYLNSAQQIKHFNSTKRDIPLTLYIQCVETKVFQINYSVESNVIYILCNKSATWSINI